MQNEPSKPEATYVIDLDKLPQATLQGHMWRQEGTQLKCMSCPFTHATFIPVGYQLYGIDDDGKPMIRKIVSSEAAAPKTQMRGDLSA